MGNAFNLGERFHEHFGMDARLYRAPGRVNLIGEHTDYNDGFVLPAAIDFDCWLAVNRRPDAKLVIYSDDFNQSFEIDLSANTVRPSQTWSDYPVGVAVHLKRAGFQLAGANILIHGEVPIGAGLSSSAAIEVGSAYALLDLAGCRIDRVQLAQLCQKAENEFVGARVGIMDQFVSLHGQRGHALLLDCRSLEYELVPIPDRVKLVICNTMVKHELASGEYNRRRAECEEAVHRLSAVLPGICALRDVNLEQLEIHRALLPENICRRAYHVISENARVLQAGAALRAGNLEEFGEAMAKSHESLRDFYEVSCPELDVMVQLANQQRGIYGARMTGGGFGGCTINLADVRYIEEFREQVAQAYEQATGITPQIYVCSAADGAGAAAPETGFGASR
jgi:galactokinase